MKIKFIKRREIFRKKRTKREGKKSFKKIYVVAEHSNYISDLTPFSANRQGKKDIINRYNKSYIYSMGEEAGRGGISLNTVILVEKYRI